MSVHERTRAWRLTVACARRAAGVGDARDVGIAATLVDDWAAAERLACTHGLLPWLARGLTESGEVDGAAAPVIAAASASARNWPVSPKSSVPPQSSATPLLVMSRRTMVSRIRRACAVRTCCEIDAHAVNSAATAARIVNGHALRPHGAGSSQ